MYTHSYEDAPVGSPGDTAAFPTLISDSLEDTASGKEGCGAGPEDGLSLNPKEPFRLSELDQTFKIT